MAEDKSPEAGGYSPGWVGCGALLLLAALVVLSFGIGMTDLLRALHSDLASIGVFVFSAFLALSGVLALALAREGRR